MAEGFDIKIVQDEFSRAVREYPGALFRRMSAACRNAAMFTRKETIIRRLSGPRLFSVARRTGALARSIQANNFGSNLDNSGYAVWFDTNVAPYAPYLEPPPDIGMVKPKGHPFLAIPLSDAMTPAGVVRTQYRAAPGGSLRSVPGLHLTKRGHKLFLTMLKGKKELFLYVLKPWVRIPRRLRFVQLFHELLAPEGGAFRFLALGVRAAAEDWHRQSIR